MEVLFPDRPPRRERLDIADLAAMPQKEIHAVTPWTVGEIRFEGVPFAALAEHMGVDRGVAVLRALNAYQTTLDVAQTIADGGLLALRQDGARLRVRDRGPIWLVFPSAAQPELAMADNFHMWIWQVHEIRFDLR